MEHRTMAVLYGTETGNSEEIAQELGEMAERLHFETIVAEMNSFNLKDLLHFTAVVFVLSTTGQGEMPRNSLELWKSMLRKKLPPRCLGPVKFTIFGLGDSSYPKFNWAARKLHKRLSQLGASEFLGPGEGDERHDDGWVLSSSFLARQDLDCARINLAPSNNLSQTDRTSKSSTYYDSTSIGLAITNSCHVYSIDSIYLPWYQSLRTALLAVFPLPDSVEPISDDVQLPPKVILRILPTMGEGQLIEGRSFVPAKDLHFLEDRDKSAAFSHVDHPRSKREQIDIDKARKLPDHSYIARANEAWEIRTGMKADMLDKNNVLQDHPHKYLLKKAPEDSDRPPDDMLPLPKTFIAHVVKNERITPKDHWQDVRFLSFGFDKAVNEELQKDEREKKRKEREQKKKKKKMMMKGKNKKEDEEEQEEEEEDEGVFPEIHPASTLIIYPKNYPADAQELIDLMGWQGIADRPLEWFPCGDKRVWAPKPPEDNLRLPFMRPRNIYAPNGATLRFLLTHNLDITAVPKRSFIRDIMYYAGDEQEKARLKELIMLGNNQEFYDYTSRPRRTILELLADFPSVKIPWQVALDLFPPIRGREFSVANGGISMMDLMGEDGPYDLGIQILAALVEYKTVIRKPRQGLCSRYLKTLPVGTAVRVGFKINHHGPSCNEISVQRPLIAVATGTGIAPIRNLFEERDYYTNPGNTQGASLLFFGCRNETADFFFKDEWSNVPDCEVIPAFSRDPVKDPALAASLDPYDPPPLVSDLLLRRSKDAVVTDGDSPGGGDGDSLRGAPATRPPDMHVPDYDAGKNYVQHQIRRHAVAVADMLRLDPIICICGNSGRMPRSVKEAFLDVMVRGGIAENRADAEKKWWKLSVWQETW